MILCFYIFVFLKNKKSFLKSSRPSLPLKKESFLPLRLSCKESSTFLTKPLFPQEREDVTALWCSEPLRYKVGGPSKVFAMVVRDGTAGSSIAYLCYINQRSDCDRVGYIQIGSLYIHSFVIIIACK